MVSLVVANGLLTLLAVVAATGISFSWFALVWILKIVSARSKYSKVDRKNELFTQHENGWFFWSAWFGACFTTALSFSYFFDKYFQTPDINEIAPTILACIWLYEVFMLFWALFQYVWTFSNDKVQYLFIILAFISGVVSGVLAIIKDQCLGTIIVAVLPLIPPILAALATRDATIFRKGIAKSVADLDAAPTDFSQTSSKAVYSVPTFNAVPSRTQPYYGDD